MPGFFLAWAILITLVYWESLSSELKGIFPLKIPTTSAYSHASKNVLFVADEIKLRSKDTTRLIVFFTFGDKSEANSLELLSYI